ncbi:MAG: lipoprotein signal peptidase [Paludibacter sp.]|jgi:signal peptidase II|nr:lipoprotein signal peptidase [Paludibacter sp.]
MSIKTKSILLIFIILLIDQTVKIYIKLNFALGEYISISSWFKILFVENPGMAFGMEFGGKTGKLFLTIFRIIAVGALGYFIHTLIKKGARQGYILTISLLLVGAAGNIFDSVFYGVLFSDSAGMAATFLPETGGYAPLFYGKVVDMLYFPLFTFPQWMPFVGGDVFFSPVFNIADSSICIAVAIILIFFRRDLNESLENKSEKFKI